MSVGGSWGCARFGERCEAAGVGAKYWIGGGEYGEEGQGV
jgi:hypothetical protein